MPEIISHRRDRLTFRAPRSAESTGKILLRLGSVDDRDHADPKQHPRQHVSSDALKALKAIPAFRAMLDKHELTLIDAAPPPLPAA